MDNNPGESWIKKFPIMMFAIVMGLTGLVIVFEKAYFLFGSSRWVHLGLLSLSSLLFVAFVIIFALKFIYHFNDVRAEFRHPVKSSFFSTIPISLLLLSIAYYNDPIPLLAMVLWYLGVPVQTALLLLIFSRWIRLDFDILHANPAWFIPIVGTILVPVIGTEIAPPIVSIIFFAVGFFFWISFFSIKLYRVVFHKQLAERFIPTLFILIAPPAVGLIAYFKITGTLNLFGYGLYGISLFFFALFATMLKHFRVPNFYISWWAFTFPLDAIAIASMLIFEVTRTQLFMGLSLFFVIVATAVVGFIALVTSHRAVLGTLLEEG